MTASVVFTADELKLGFSTSSHCSQLFPGEWRWDGDQHWLLFVDDKEVASIQVKGEGATRGYYALVFSHRLDAFSSLKRAKQWAELNYQEKVQAAA